MTAERGTGLRLAYILPLLGALPAVTIALFGFAAHDSGAFEPVPCGREVKYQTEHAKLTDRYVKGYIAVGFEPDVTIQEASALLDGTGAHWAFDYPYNHSAMVCTRPGEEKAWEERLKGLPEVQFAHQEGVRPLDIQN